MDFIAPLKNEIYRPIVTIIIPGIAALAPFAYLLAVNYPVLAQAANGYPTLAAVLSFLAVNAAGLILEDLGSWIEKSIFDRSHSNKKKMREDWYDYLRLQYDKEPIAMDYIRSIVLRFKFELSFAIALVFAEIGCFIIKCTTVPNFPWVVLVPIFIVGLYLFWEAHRGSKLLAELRSELLPKNNSERDLNRQNEEKTKTHI